MDYTPDTAPDASDWLALAPQERIQAAMHAHKGCFPDGLHTENANPMMHGSLHAILETQIAEAKPAVTGETLSRLQAAGLARHAALHAIMRILAGQLAALRGGGTFDHEGWRRELTALQAADVVGNALKRIRPSTQPNRAERRKQKKSKT